MKIAEPITLSGSDGANVLIVEDGTLSVGIPQKGPLAPRFVLQPVAWGQYKLTNRPLQDLEDGIEIDATGETVRIKTSACACFPVGYHASPGLVVVARSPGEVAAALRRRGRKLQPDRVGILESLLIDYPFLNRTYFEGVHKSRMGETVQIAWKTGRVTAHKHWQLRLYSNPEIGSQDASNRGTEILEDLFQRQPQKGAHIALSGGLDSRMIACFAARSGVTCTTFSFGGYISADLTLGKRVAKCLDLKWQPIELRPADYLTCGNQVIDLTGGLVSGMHMHLFSCLERLDRDFPFLSVGYLGEHAAGDHAIPLESSVSLDAAVEKLVSTHFAQNPLWVRLTEPDRHAILEDLHRLAKECCQANQPCTFDEYIGCTERQSGLITYIVNILEPHCQLFRPFANQAYIDFFSSLGPQHRINRTLFRQVGRRLFPGVFSLATADMPLGPLIPGEVQRGYVRLRNLLQYSTAKLTDDRFVYFSPFVYEQHALVLRTNLSSQHAAAIDFTERFLGLDLSAYRIVPRRLGRSAHTLFRVMAIERVFGTATRDHSKNA